MVTTRRGAGTGPSTESTPASSVRKTRGKRNLEAEVQETPTASKRRRQAAPKGEAAAGASQDSVETPATAEKNEHFYTPAVAMPHRTKANNAEENTPVARRGSPKVLISAPPSVQSADETQETGLASAHDDVFYTPVQQSFSAALRQGERDGSVTPKQKPKAGNATPASAKGTRKRGRPRKHPLPEEAPAEPNSADEIPSSTWDSEQAPLSPTKQETDSEGSHPPVQDMDDANATTTTTAKPARDQMQELDSVAVAHEDLGPNKTTVTPSRHKRFGSEEAAEVADTTTQVDSVEEATNDDDDGDASDSDEAPEMVTASAAASKVKAAAEETARARQAQLAKEEKRRQQRAERVAEEQAEKRKREEKKAQKLAKREAKLAGRQQPEAPSLQGDAMDIDMHELPDLLPASILEAAGDRRPPTPPAIRVGKTEEELRKEKMNRHIKFLERGERPVKDVKKGKLNVSVLTQRNMLLAPKVNRDTKNIREHWLKGREADRKGRGGRKGMSFKKMERRSVGGGFLRGRDDD